MNIPKKSVAVRIIISVATVSTVLLLMLGIVANKLVSDRWRNQLRSEEAILADQLAESIALPLWNFDHSQMDKIMESAMQNKNIYGIAVIPNGKNERVYAKVRDTEWRTSEAERASFPDGLLLQEREIHFANEPIGRVRISATPKFTEAFLRNNRLVLVSILLPFNLILAACLYFVLWRWVVRPLKEVEAFAVTVSSGSEEDWDVRTVSFYGELESVRASIAKMVDQLKTRYRVLQKVMVLRRASEERLQTVYDSVNDAIFIHDTTNGAIVDVNIKMCVMYGLTRDEALKFNIGALSSGEHPFTQKGALDKIAKATAGEPQIFEWHARHKDGHLFWVEVNMKRAVIAGEDRVIVVVRDITKRKQAEDAIRKSEARFRGLTEKAPVAISISRDGKTIYVNHKYLDLYGFQSVEELIGQPIFDQWAPESRELIRERAQKRARGEAVPSEYEGTGQRKDGSQFPVHIVVEQVELPDGPAFIAFLSDITERKRAEEALQIRAQLLDRASDSIFLLDQDGRILYANEAASISRGYSREEMTLLNIRDLVPPGIARGVGERIGEIFEKGEVIFESTHIRRDGTLFPVEISVRAMEIGSMKYIISIVRDITERKRAEESLRKSEEMFSKLFMLAPVGIAFTTLADGRFVNVNNEFERVFGFSLNEAVGKTGAELGIWLDPKDRENIVQIIRTEGKIKDLDIRVKGKRGNIITWRYNAERIELNGQDYLLAASMDITKLKEGEEALRDMVAQVSQSQKEWQDTFDSITDLISIHDRNFNVVKVNKAFTQFMGLPYEQIIGEKCYELLHRATEPLPGCPHMRVLSDGKPAADEQFDTATGRTLHISTYPFQAPDGSLIGTIHISRDVTEEKEREVRLIMTERLASLGQMASGIAHEINNPLESVMICAEMLLMQVGRDHYDRSQFEKYLKIIDEEVLRCREITSNMLSFSRQTTHDQTDVDAHLLLDKAIDLVRYQGRLKNVTVISHFASKLLVRGSEGELRQVFLAIVVNALDAMDNKGTLTIKTGTQDGNAWIQISDTGPGIPPEILDKIFQPFFTTKLGKGGTGLGLSIAHRIIANHHGSLTVSSEPGQGSTFNITLPL